MQKLFSLSQKRVLIAGHGGMVGAALTRHLVNVDCEILTAGRTELDLRSTTSVEEFMFDTQPDVVFMAAAKVGGILANQAQPAEFIYDNLMIAANITQAAHRAGVSKMLFLGSSCIYPRLANQPIQEESLLTGPLEPTNEWYAIAKIAGVKLGQAYRKQYGFDFISVMPTNLYGPGDNFDQMTSHVLPALMDKAHNAKVRNSDFLEVWGSGTPTREFLHVDDCANACIFLMEHYSDLMPINLGSGSEISISGLAVLIASVVDFRGDIRFDHTKPDGTPRKLLDSTRLHQLGWSPRIALDEGIAETYEWYKKNHIPRDTIVHEKT